MPQIHDAVEAGDIASVRAALERGVSPTSLKGGLTAFAFLSPDLRGGEIGALLTAAHKQEVSQVESSMRPNDEEDLWDGYDLV